MANRRQKVSMQSIADALNISKNAVSIALSGKSGISDDLRDRIEQTASRLGYSGTKRKSMREKHILFLVDEQIQFSDVFYYRIFSEVTRHAQQLNHHILIASVTRKMQQDMALPDLIHQFPVCGVLVMGLIGAPYLQKIMDKGLPLVMFINRLMNVPTDVVMSDNVNGAFQMVSHLIEMGHTKIGFLSNFYSYRCFFDRWQGYKLALHTAGLPIVPEYSIVSEINYGAVPHQGDHRPMTEDEIQRCMDTILHMPDPPTVWMCGHDPMAHLLITELQKRGIRIPEDISVAGYDNIEVSPLMRTQLTTIDDRREVMARHAVDLLLQHAQNPESWNPVTISVIGEVIPGGTVKRLR